jgi:hypothetical protein
MARLAWKAVPLNVALNVVCIPIAHSLWGNAALACAAVTAATEVFMGVFVWRAAWPLIDRNSVLSGLARALAAAASMGFIVLAIRREVPLPVSIGVGVCAYGVAAVATGAISRGDVQRFRELVVLRRQAA